MLFKKTVLYLHTLQFQFRPLTIKIEQLLHVNIR
jgi:hypothetical protein